MILKFINLQVIILLFLALLLPDTLFALTPINNFSLSTLISLIIITILLLKVRVKIETLQIILFFLIIIFISIITGHDIATIFELKTFFSVLAMIVLIYTASQFASYITNIQEDSLIQAFNSLFYFLFSIGWLSIMLIKLSIIKDKTMIIFAEPSAFALIFTPIYALYIYKKNSTHFIFVFILSLCLSILIQNLTLLVGIFTATYLTRRFKFWHLLLSLIPIIIFYLSIHDELSYFSDRINFKNSTNISTLVYLSGIERAYLNLIDSLGLGIGFQQMGFNNILGESQYALKALGYESLNIYDGSFIAAKLISELGIWAILFITFYIYNFIKIAIFLKNKKPKYICDIIFSIYYLTFSIPLFIRGSGYINPYTFMFLVSIFGFHLISKNKNLKT